MIGLVFNLTIVVILVMLAFVRPGAGIAVALALGRHTFPDRSAPIIAAAPLLLIAATLALYRERRAIRLTVPSVVAAVAIASVAFVGYLASSGTSDPAVQFLNNDRTFFLLCVSVPLVLLAPSLSDWPVRRDFLLALVLVPTALVTLSVLTGSSDAEGSGRSTALGGGPITLATAAGFAILILLFHDDDVLPSWFRELTKPFRAVTVLYLAVGVLLTGSRQPLLSLMIVLGMASFAAASGGSTLVSSAEAKRRMRRLRVASASLAIVGIAGLFAFVTARPDSRFALLLDPTRELRRSRLGVWEGGFERIADSPLFGHGFGSFVTYRFPHGSLDYPHNVFLELMGESGVLVGGVSSLLIVLGIVVARSRSMRVFWLLSVYALFGVQFSGDLYNSRYLMFFMVAALTVRLPVEGEPGDDAVSDVRDDGVPIGPSLVKGRAV